MKNRMRHMSFLFLLLFFVLVARLIQIQLLQPESFSNRNINLIEESVNQRVKSYILDEGRGTFVDRNGQPLLEKTDELVIFPNLSDLALPVDKLAEWTGISQEQLRIKLSTAKRPLSFPIDEKEVDIESINQWNIPGVYLTTKTNDKQPFAHHIIGFTGQNLSELKRRYPDLLEKGIVKETTKIGLTGLEEAFDPFLISDGEAKLHFHVDNIGKPLLGLDVKYVAPANPFYPLQVKTTIDKEIQIETERAIDAAGITNGGAVLLDVETNDTLALVSRPTFDHDDPFERGATNEMISSHVPGSVFKVVTAAAVIDQGKASEGRTFNCNLNLYGDSEANRQLGELSFADSFIQSCNRTFGELANELMKEHPTFFEDYAERLSLADLSGWSGDVYHFENFTQFPKEEPNRIWSSDYRGELDVRLTPLSVANMMATIARGGEQRKVRLVSELLYKQGSSVITFPQKRLVNEELDEDVTAALQDLLRKVVTDPQGTGFSRALDQLPYTVAGKSGTAETDGQHQLNQWFGGYFPFQNPQYALVVVDLNHSSGETGPMKRSNRL